MPGIYSSKRTPTRRGTRSKYTTPQARRKLRLETPYGDRPMNSPPARRVTRPAYEKVGRPVGTDLAKRAVVDSNWNTPAAAALAEGVNRNIVLTNVAQNISSGAINTRQRAMINCLGFDLRFYLQNRSTSEAMVVNIAVAAPRNQNATIPDGFFRGYGAVREQDFPADANLTDANLLNMTPLNADDMNIIWRHQITLGPDGNEANAVNYERVANNYIKFKKWIPIGRQLRYDGTGGNNCEDPINLCIWVCRPGKSSYDTALTEAVIIKHDAIMFFKEPGV